MNSGNSDPTTVPASIRDYQAKVHSAKRWDEEYANGRWDYLENLSELARFCIVVGYCAFLKPKSSILEVGCGSGILMRRLRVVGYSSYFGVDLSREAI